MYNALTGIEKQNKIHWPTFRERITRAFCQPSITAASDGRGLPSKAKSHRNLMTAKKFFGFGRLSPQCRPNKEGDLFWSPKLLILK